METFFKTRYRLLNLPLGCCRVSVEIALRCVFAESIRSMLYGEGRTVPTVPSGIKFNGRSLGLIGRRISQ